MAKKINITAQLNAATTDGILADAGQIFDAKKGKFQEQVNEEFEDALEETITSEDTGMVVESIEEGIVHNALRKTEQILTEAEKGQARENIGAVSEQTFENEAVRVKKQVFTSEQKYQARHNISAITAEEAEKIAQDKICETSVSSPDKLQAVKELSSWLEENPDNAATMNAAIQENAADIQRLYRGTGIDEYSRFSTGMDYAAGDVVLYDGVLFRFKADHAKGAWDYNEVENWSEKKERERAVMKLDSKLIKLTGIAKNYEYANAKNIGDVYFNTSTNTLKRVKHVDSSGAVTFTEEVPFYDGAIYQCEGYLYTYNGTTLINKTNEDILAAEKNNIRISNKNIIQLSSFEKGMLNTDGKKQSSNYFAYSKDFIKLLPNMYISNQNRLNVRVAYYKGIQYTDETRIEFLGLAETTTNVLIQINNPLYSEAELVRIDFKPEAGTIEDATEFVTANFGVIYDNREDIVQIDKRTISKDVFYIKSYISADGASDRPNQQYISTDFIKVKGGDKIKISAYVASSMPIVSFYSEAKMSSFVQDLLIGDSTLSEKETTILEDGYIRLCARAQDLELTYVYIGESLMERLDEHSRRLDDAEKEIDNIYDNIADNATNIFNKENVTEVCVHHDNFSREMSDYEIGSNSLDGEHNNYEDITGVSSDDGVRVNNGLSITPASVNFAIRKITAKHERDFMIETSVPMQDNSFVRFAIDYTDNKNFKLVSLYRTNAKITCSLDEVINNSYPIAIKNKSSQWQKEALLLNIYVIAGEVYFFLDGEFFFNAHIGHTSEYVYIVARKNETNVFSFVNLFNISSIPIFNPNFLLDRNIDVRRMNTSANDGRYSLQNNVTCFSDMADRMYLTPDEPEVLSGIRCERTIIAPESHRYTNLRTRRIDFDVMFPTDTVESLWDCFFQLHDRQEGTARNKVPFEISRIGDDIGVSLHYTISPTETTGVTRLSAESTIYSLVGQYDKWHHVSIFIRERYDKAQMPRTEIYIDNTLVFASNEPNCFNDIIGDAPQYGIYFGHRPSTTSAWWTHDRVRYFDNMIIKYL